MTRPMSALLVGVMLFAVTSCSDHGPSLLRHEDQLLIFKRVTLAAASPDRAEIEVEVLTGPGFSEPAPDGTAVVFKTSHGTFDNHAGTVERGTVRGHAVATLILPEPTRLAVTARVRGAENRLFLDVKSDGTIVVPAR